MSRYGSQCSFFDLSSKGWGMACGDVNYINILLYQYMFAMYVNDIFT